MDTRILSTDIWRDQEFRKLDDKDARILLFILTNDQVTVLPAYKIGLDEIAFYTGTNSQRIEGLIPRLEYFGVYFIEGYFLLTNKFTRAKYSGGNGREKRAAIDKRPAIGTRYGNQTKPREIAERMKTHVETSLRFRRALDSHHRLRRRHAERQRHAARNPRLRGQIRIKRLIFPRFPRDFPFER